MSGWVGRRAPWERVSSLHLIVVAAILVVQHLFRTSVFVSLAHRCLPPHEFWIESLPPSWPLIGAFAGLEPGGSARGWA